MRSIFSAGLLDGFLLRDFKPFDYYIGVSAGAFNLVNYIVGNEGASRQIFIEVARNPHFINYARFVRGGHLLDLDWLSNRIMHEFNPDSLMTSLGRRSLFICTTVVETGQAAYFTVNPAIYDQVMKATAALPLIYRGFPLVNGIPMADGGIADGLPVEKAIRLGAKRIMVIRSRPLNYIKKDTLWHKFIRWKMKRHPALVQTMNERIQRFDNAIKLIRQPPEDVKVLEICPPEQFTMGRFGRNLENLVLGYNAGLDTANTAILNWRSIA